MKRPLNLFAGLLALSASVHAQLGHYSYMRPVDPVPATAYYRLPVNSDILYAAKSTASLRVFSLGTKDTVEVPYVLHDAWVDKTCAYQFRIINSSYVKGEASYYTLVADSSLIYSSITFSVDENEYDKDISLEGSFDNKTWKTIVENDKLFRFWRNDNDHFTRNTVYLPAQSYPYLRLRLDDGHSPRVHISGASTWCSPETGRKSEGEEIPFKVHRTEDKKSKQTIIDCEFPRKYVLTGIRFDVAHEAPFFRRHVSIYQNGIDNRRKEQWFYYQDNYLVSNAYNYMPVDEMAPGRFFANKLRVVVDNLDDQPLRAIDLKLYTQTEVLRLKLEKDKRYVLAYGTDKASVPGYDIEHFKAQIPATLQEARLGEEQALPKQLPLPPREPLFKSNWWIWSLMLVSILLIGWFAVSMLRQSKRG